MPVIYDSQKHEVLHKLEELGFLKSDFRKDERTSYYRIIHIETGMHFTFEHPIYPGNITISFSQGFDFKDYRNVTYTFDNAVKNLIPEWTKRIRKVLKESTIKDPWDEVANDFLGSSFDKSKGEKFSESDVKQLEAKLDLLSAAVTPLNLPEPTNQELLREIKELREEVKNLTRKKWFQRFVGTFAFYLVKGVIENESARTTIMEHVKEILSMFISGVGHFDPKGLL